jgi:4-amino-4-deoxy-L-arabinose transferase-like glycosyltransferase
VKASPSLEPGRGWASKARQSKRVGLALFAAALVSRLFAAWAADAIGRPEVFEYEAIARSLVAGKGFSYPHLGGVIYHSFTAPLYPFFCAGVYGLGGSVTTVLLAQIVAGSFLAWLVGAVGTQLFGRQAGLVAGLLAAFHPGLVVYSSLKAHPLTFDALAIVVLFSCLVSARASSKALQAAIAGLALGLSVLSRPTTLVFLPVGAAWLLATRGKSLLKHESRRAALLALVALVAVTPWVIRNYRVHQRFVFMQTTGWEAFWRGNNPLATGHSYATPTVTVLELAPEADRRSLERLPDEHQQASWFRRRGLEFVRSSPGHFLELTGKKLFSFWWLGPQTGTRYPRSWRLAYQAYYLVALGLALGGALVVRKFGTAEQRRAAMLLGLMLFSLSLAQSLFYVEGRHRWAVEPLLLLLCGVREKKLDPGPQDGQSKGSL